MGGVIGLGFGEVRPQVNRRIMLSREWIAGFFDGEGCITVLVELTKRGYHRNRLHVSLTQKDPTVLYEVKNEFGGNVYPKRKNDNSCYHWIICSLNALPFLLAIQPYAKIKKYQIDLAVRFLETVKHSHICRGKSLDNEIYLRREQIASSIKLAKTISPSKILETAGNPERAICNEAQLKFDWERSETIMGTPKGDGIVRHSEESEKNRLLWQSGLLIERRLI